MKLEICLLTFLLLVKPGTAAHEARSGDATQESREALQKRGLENLLTSNRHRAARNALEKPTPLICKKIFQGSWIDC